ncbi:hypothetical protein FOZ62_004701, partial [Perkinsus olseni]
SSARSFALRIMHDTTVDGSLSATSFDDPLEAIFGWFAGRLTQALAARMSMFDVSDRRAYRVLNYEGDGVTGVALDVYESIAVVYVSAQWVCMEGLKERFERIILETVPRVAQVVWRFRRDLLAADGGDGIDKRSDESVALTIEENSLKFSVDVGGGKKTGWFLDQSDNRRKLMEYVRRNRVGSVADLCCYTGGFAIHAAAGGAKRVVGVDIQERSIVNAKANAELNGTEIASRIEWAVSDVGDFCRERGTEEFDLIVLDPPNIVKAGDDDHRLPKRTLRKFAELSLGRINRLKGGCLWVFSCSHELSKEGVLEEVVGGAAVRAGRRVRVAEQLEASIDHMYSPYHANSKHLRGLVRWLVMLTADAGCQSSATSEQMSSRRRRSSSGEATQVPTHSLGEILQPAGVAFCVSDAEGALPQPPKHGAYPLTDRLKALALKAMKRLRLHDGVVGLDELQQTAKQSAENLRNLSPPGRWLKVSILGLDWHPQALVALRIPPPVEGETRRTTTPSRRFTVKMHTLDLERSLGTNMRA